MTDTGIQESTAATLQRLFPATSNYMVITYNYYGYGGTGADGMAVILSDGSVTPKPGGFGGSLGYAPKSSASAAGFAGGWLGIGLDEYGNFANKNDSGACAPGVSSCATSAVKQSVSMRGSASNYYWLKGSGTLATTVSNTTGHLYRITVDSRTSGKAYVTVERDTTGAGSSYSTLISSTDMLAQSGQAALPSNFLLSLTGSTGDDTNTHEIDNLTVCAQSMNAMTAINHYRFAVNTGLTCTPSAVTVTACMDADCTSTYSGSVTATLTSSATSANDGWVAGNTQTFTSGSTLYLRQTTAGSYSIGVSASSPVLTAYSVGAMCSINGGSYSTANCAAIPFEDSGFLVSAPTQTSGKTSNSTDGTLVSISAVKKADDSLSCTPAFADVSRSVKLWSSYSSPSTGSKTLAVNGTTIGTTAATATATTLSFNSSGVATGITLNYADAGRLTLNASYTGSTANNDAGLSMTGAGNFVTVPYALCVDSQNSGWNCTASQTNAQTPTNCSIFKAAGDSFTLRVTGKSAIADSTATCGLATTPNYVHSGIPITSTVFAPSGQSNGSLTLTPHNSSDSGSIDITTGGTATVTATQAEVGVFTLSAAPTAGSYLGASVPSGSAVFGRFIPKGFKLTSTLTNRSDVSCSAASTFTYLGEPLSASITLSAVNAAGAPTSNYVDNFARLNRAVVSTAGAYGLAFGAQSGTTLLNSRLTATCSNCPVFSGGSSAITAALTLARASGSTVDGPWTPTFGLVATDPDGVGMFNPNFSWGLTGTNNGLSLGSSTLYFGRMRLETAYGSPALSLRVPAYAQYWNGSTFVKNTADSCTRLTVPTSVAMSGTTAATLYCGGGVGLYGSLAGVTATLNSVTAGSTATLASGDAGALLSKPTNSGGGYLDFALLVPDYLKYNVDGVDQTVSGTTCTTPGDGYLHDDNPRARIRFGIRRADDVIYLREVY